MRRTMVAVMLTVLMSGSVWGKNYVVCVGVNTYAQASSLQACVNDAAAVCRLYQNVGNSEVKLIFNQNATRATVLHHLRQLFLRAGRGDAILLFFSGHGIPGGLVCYDGYLTYESILAVMRQSSASKKMIIADVCFAGTARIQGHSQNHYSTESVMFFLSSRSREVSREANGNGLFTRYLVQGLQGQADANRDRRVSARELFQFVHNGVSRASRNRQHPVMWGRFDNNMTIIQR